MNGKARVLPFDAPGVPPPVPFIFEVGKGYLPFRPCRAEIEKTEVPHIPGTREWLSAYYCTQPPHGEDHPHVCHLRQSTTHEPIALIVWGGE